MWWRVSQPGVGSQSAVFKSVSCHNLDSTVPFESFATAKSEISGLAAVEFIRSTIVSKLEKRKRQNKMKHKLISLSHELF